MARRDLRKSGVKVSHSRVSFPLSLFLPKPRGLGQLRPGRETYVSETVKRGTLPTPRSLVRCCRFGRAPSDETFS